MVLLEHGWSPKSSHVVGATYSASKTFTAFTMAEVLITLSIIGVVAAMTMPVLVASIREKSLESAKLKAQSSLVNGYKQLMARQGIFNASGLSLMNCTDVSCFSQLHHETFKIVDDSASGLTQAAYPQNYTNEDGDDVPFSWSQVPYLFRTADGMSYGVELDDGKETFSIFADTNGQKRPNKACKDMLKFRFSGSGNIANVCGELEQGGCSIDNLSACNAQECQDLAAQKEYLAAVADIGIFNSQGHFITFGCGSEGVQWSDDWCEITSDPDYYDYQNGLRKDLYCR